MNTNQVGLAMLSGALLAGCSLSLAGSPTTTPIVGAEVTLGGPTLPPSWTPDVTPTPPGTATPGSTLTPTLTPSPYPSPTLAPGWSEYRVPEDGFAFSLPPTWLPLPLDAQSPLLVLAQIEQDEPVLALSLSYGLPEGMLNNLSFIAFDSSAAARDAPFVSTVRVSRAGSGDYQQEAARRGEALEADPAFTLEADWPVRVGSEARGGWLLRYTSVFPPDTPLVTTHHTQVYVDNGRGEVVVITFSTEGALREGYERLFELVLDTVRFAP